MDSNIEYVSLQFNINGEAITANVPVELVQNIYEDEQFRTEFLNNLMAQETDNNTLGSPGLENCPDEDNVFKWTDNATKLLIQSYKEELSGFRDQKTKKSTIWQKISRKFLKYGHAVNADVCDRKFRNMKATYKNIKDNCKKTGRGRQNWDYFKMMDELFQNDSTINPPLLISSFKSSCDTAKPSSSHTLTITNPDTKLKPIPNVLPKTAQCPEIINAQPSTSRATPPCEEIVNESDQITETGTRQANRNKKNRELQKYRQQIIEIEKQKLREMQEINRSYKKIAECMEERNNILRGLATRNDKDA